MFGKKEQYDVPWLEIVDLYTCDIVTASGSGSDDDSDVGDWDSDIGEWDTEM